MVSSVKRRLSVSVDDVQRRLDPEQSERRGLLGGPFGRWLEDELDYQRNMLPGIDNMWLLLDQDSDFNPVCASIYTFADAPDFEGLIRVWGDMADRFPAYRQRVTGLHRRLHTVRLREDPAFDVRNHVLREELPPGKNGKHALEDAMAAFVARDWDLGRPLWEVKVLYGYDDGTGARAALIARAHHTLSDGQGFVLSQLSTTSARATIEKKLAAASQKYEAIETGNGAKLSDLPVDALTPYLRPLDPFVPSELVTLLFWALYALFTVVSILYGTYAALRAVFLFLTFRKRALAYDGPRPAEKEFSFSEAVALTDIKTVQKAFASPARKLTLNDVMCAVAAKALRGYFEHTGQAPDKRIALFIPISLRAPSDQKMGNQSTGMIAYFRSDAGMGTQALVDAAHDEMRTLKTSFWPRVAFGALELLYRAPVLFPAATSRVVGRALTGYHAVLTNVPGPQAPIDVDGARVLRWTASPPQAGKGTLGIGMISYDGHLVWTVTADKTPEHAGIARYLTDAFHKTFEEFLVEAREKVKD